MQFNYSVFAVMLLAMVDCGSNKSDNRSRRKRYLIEPVNTQMGLFATLSVPLEYQKQVSVAYFFEGNYYTLANASWVRPAFEAPVVQGRRNEKRSLSDSLPFNSLSRKFAYIVLENNIEKQGLPGRACLLRTICEHAETPLRHNGVMGDFLYIIFTPSSSRDEELPDEFYEAENRGKYENCNKFINTCPISIINSISFTHDDP